MSEYNTYLTDEELEQLIADVEAHEMVSAPPDLMEGVFAGIFPKFEGELQHCADVKRLRNLSSIQKKKDYQFYCFRVIASVAAAILLLFISPEISELQLKLSEVVEGSGGNEAWQEERLTPRYATKEEALNDRGILSATFGSNHLFDEDRNWKIFE